MACSPWPRKVYAALFFRTQGATNLLKWACVAAEDAAYVFGMADKDRRFVEPKKDPLWDDPKLRKKHEEYLKEHKRRLRELEYQSSDGFMERPPRWQKD